jgi:hypothetical protein
MASLWIVTPAHGRLGLTSIVFEQRARLCDELIRRGIDANCVVVACDENLELADEFGFASVERDNEWLGMRFNDGYQAAARLGVDYVMPCGSDSFLDPSYFDDLPSQPDSTIKLSRWYSVYPAAGDRRGEIYVKAPIGVSFTIPTTLLEPFGYRPCENAIKKGCDTSTFRTITRPRRSSDWSLVEREGHPLEIVGFHTNSETQISSYHKLVRRWGVREVTEQPFDALRAVYPTDLVDRVVDYYAEGATG